VRSKQITENDNSTAVMAFGRMNPPTIGHAKLVDALKSQPGDPYLFLTHTQKPKTDPLDFETKIKFAKRFFPDISIGSSNVRTIVQALQKIEDMGYKNVIYVAGSDRVEDFSKFLKKYNEVDPHFDSIRVVSAGERDPDAAGAEGMSASRMRELAKAGDFKEFEKGVPVSSLADKLYNAVRQAMGVKEPATESKETKMTTRLLKEFANHLEEIIGTRLDEMFEMEDEYGDEQDDLDSDEPEDSGFTQTPMFDQLGKVLDSQDGNNPINTVETDDGETFDINPDQARALRLLGTTEKVKPDVKREFLRDIQSSAGLTDFLDQTDYHEMAHLFVKRYLA
jgi:hypothetical protein